MATDLQQEKWLIYLASVNPQEKIQVCHNVKHPRIPLIEAIEKLPVNHRVILNNEIVIEYDYPEYEKNAQITKITTQILKDAQIPFIMGYTGGKSIHIHIFLDLNVEITETTKQRLDAIHFEKIWLRNHIAKKYLMKRLHEIAKSQHGESKLDEVMLYAKHPVREFGGLHDKTSKRKTFLTEVPDAPPQDYEVAYPNEIKLWRCESIIQTSLSHIKPPKKKIPNPNYCFSPRGAK
jgi:hypothetical protein